MEDCLFCKIVRGEIPCYKIYEDEYTLAFLDISNDGIGGHTLVVPKTHHADIISAPQKVLNRLVSTVKKISRHYVQGCGFDGVNVFNNCGECAGQSIMHIHFHIVPRKNADKINTWKIGVCHNQSLDKLCKRLTLQK